MMYNREKGSDSMIYLQIGIFILEIILCIILNNLLKDKLNEKIRYAICIAFVLNCWNMRTYQAMWAIHTLFCLLVLLTLFKKKKTNILHNSISYNIHIHRNIWICQYVHDSSNHI